MHEYLKCIKCARRVCVSASWGLDSSLCQYGCCVFGGDLRLLLGQAPPWRADKCLVLVFFLAMCI